jgi:hypothetical protein
MKIILTEHVFVVPKSTRTFDNYVIVEFCRQIQVVVIVEDKCPGTAKIAIVILKSLQENDRE